MQAVARAAAILAAGVLLSGAVHEFYNIAWGTGAWYGEISLKWAVALIIFVAACILAFVGWIRFVRRAEPQGRASGAGKVPKWLGWFLIIAGLAFPVGILQYTPWGIVMEGPYLRILLWAICAALVFVGRGWTSGTLWLPNDALAAILLSGSVLVIGSALTEITDFPFSLGWSEGNRLWDYSLLFGRHLYSFDPGHEPIAYLDFGRQLLGGLPFLLPRVSILGERLWLAILSLVPYLLVSVLAFWPDRSHASQDWMLAGLFGFIYLTQGPIHAPLLICAAMVALAWRLRLSWGVPLLIMAGYFAEISRFTWMFAPSIWILMLEVGRTRRGERPPSRISWTRAIALGTSGLVGAVAAYAGLLAPTATNLGSSAAISMSQGLLWYRLLPNATYGEGILIGLAKACVPLLVVLIYATARYRHPSIIQLLTGAGALLAFMVVGLIVSTKIGGGGDLHNLDMFLIGLLFAAAIVWRTEGVDWGIAVRQAPVWLQLVLLLMAAIPAYNALRSLRPLSFARDLSWTSVLADVERPRDLGSLPDDAVVGESLRKLQQEISEAVPKGPVLFMDQRQLLTFGYVTKVKLIPEYEKKRMMDEALSGNETYFAPFYRDLRSRRFALIVSSLLRTPIKDSDYGFGEENNAWVTWVARPVLCYYEEKDTLIEVKTQLLVPRAAAPDCSSALPFDAR